VKLARSERRHLALADLIDRTADCPVCGGHAPRPAVFRLQAGPDVHMLACPICGAASASHMPTAAYLERYYASYYRAEEQNQQVTFAEPERFARHILRGIRPKTGGRRWGALVRILDFGGGDGTLALALADRLLAEKPERRVEIRLMDFPAPRAAADPRVRISHRRPDQRVEGEHELVLASGVLEHVPEVRPLLAALFAAMAPGGFLYARTPYGLPFTRLFPDLDLTYPGHVHDMGHRFWSRVVETFGWPARCLASRPSLVESSLARQPLRTAAAHLFKLPARVEGLLSPAGRIERLWTLVGGWEAVLQKTPETP
jgi:SAM-dependent methyltransferase